MLRVPSSRKIKVKSDKKDAKGKKGTENLKNLARFSRILCARRSVLE